MLLVPEERIRDTAIVIPAFNEAAVIADVLKGALEQFKYVIVVNDGSSDNTSAVAKEAGAIVIDHFINSGGAGAATQTGIEYALGLPVDYFVTFDADGQHQVKDVLKMREEIAKGRVDIIIGSRFMGIEPKEMSGMKRAVIKAGTAFSNLTSGLKMTDTHIGLRIFNRHVAETLNLEEVGYEHASELLEKIKKNHYKYAEMPVEILYSDYSKAKGQSMLNAVNIASDVLIGKVVGK
jgi:glycosyltransferase involved in cell wall biosynthesis